MTIVLIVIVAALVFGGLAYYQYKQRQARIAAVAALGKRINFTFNEDDIERIASMPFKLFSMGDGRRVELILSGTHNNLPLKLFDYWYYVETHDQNGGTSKQYHRFTCGLLTIPAACPRMRVSHEGFFSHLGEHLGMHDVEFESEDFNRRFRVKCDDQKFAFCLIDGKMMEWLAAADTFKTVEVDGPWILLAVDKLDPSRWLDLGTWLDSFHAHIPTVLYSEYPPT